MSREDSFLTADVGDMFKHTIVVRHPLEEHFRDFEHQNHTARLGIWLFLATEVMFFGALFLALAVYRYQYAESFERASERLSWQIGGINTIVLLLSSFTMVMAVHHARFAHARRIVTYLLLTAALGSLFLVFKGFEYYIDYRENLIPGWRFDSNQWLGSGGLTPDQVPEVKIFFVLYFVMTGIHAVHLSIGIGIVLILAVLAARGRFADGYYTPVDVTGLYWHFVDIVWIFLLPMLYLMGTHSWGGG